MNSLLKLLLTIKLLALVVLSGCSRTPEDIAASQLASFCRVVRDDQISGNPVVQVDLSLHNVNGTRLEPLIALIHLRELDLSSATLNDADMKYLKGLSELERLDIGFTRISGSGLVNLKGMARLETLWLTQCNNLRDDELGNLIELHRLKDLSLTSTNITDMGLQHLKTLTNLEKLNLTNTKLKGTGLIYLKNLNKLRELILVSTMIDDAGLEHLKELTNLKLLYLDHAPNVTDNGVNDLKKALPNLMISHIP